jgi:hypothetical protein
MHTILGCERFPDMEHTVLVGRSALRTRLDLREGGIICRGGNYGAWVVPSHHLLLDVEIHITHVDTQYSALSVYTMERNLSEQVDDRVNRSSSPSLWFRFRTPSPIPASGPPIRMVAT